MRNKSMEFITTALAVGVALSAVAGYGIHKKSRKGNDCRLARAEYVQEYLDENFVDDIAAYTSAKESTSNKNGLFPSAKAAYVAEKESGIAVFEKESTKHLPIASMCKIMTLLLSFEAIDNGIITMDEEITVSENAASMGGSQVFLEENGKYPVRELLKSIVVCSANDSCVAMAERIAGSDSLFVDKMNDRAKALGCENTLFANCTGLPKEPQYSCAKDVASMLSALLEHSEYYELGKIWTDTFQHPEGRTTEISNTNRLVRFYEGCDGGKTGFTNEAGFCLAATAKRGNMRIISVVIGEPDSKTRFKEVSESFDYTFANYTMQTVVDASKQLEESVFVSGGKDKRLPIQPQRNGFLFLKRGESCDYQLQTELFSGLKAPICKGEEVGTIHIYYNGIEYDNIPLIATQNIEKAGYFDALRDVANAWNFNGK